MLADTISPDIVMLNTTISACATGAAWTQAFHLLRALELHNHAPDVTSFNSALHACGAALQWQSSICLFSEMRSKRTVDAISLLALVKVSQAVAQAVPYTYCMSRSVPDAQFPGMTVSAVVKNALLAAVSNDDGSRAECPALVVAGDEDGLVVELVDALFECGELSAHFEHTYRRRTQVGVLLALRCLPSPNSVSTSDVGEATVDWPSANVVATSNEKLMRHFGMGHVLTRPSFVECGFVSHASVSRLRHRL